MPFRFSQATLQGLADSSEVECLIEHFTDDVGGGLDPFYSADAVAGPDDSLR